MEGTRKVVFVLLLVSSYVRANVYDMNAGQQSLACITRHGVLEKIKTCYKDTGMLQSLSNSDELSDEDNIKKGCKIDPTSCLKKHLLQTTNCFTEEQEDALKKFFDVFTAGYKYACDDDGARIKEFIDNEGPQCVQSLAKETELKEVTECVQTVVNGIQGEVEEHKDDKEKLDEIGCVAFLKMKDCVLTRLKCKNEKPTELIEGLIHSMIKGTRCMKYVLSSGHTFMFEAWCAIAMLVPIFLN